MTLFYRIIFDNVQIEDTAYFVGLILCLLYGPLVLRNLKGIETRRWSATVLGLFIIIIAAGYQSCHLIFAVTVAALLKDLVGKKNCHVVVFTFMMVYMTAFRIYTYNETYRYIHLSTIQMLITCKVAGVAYEIHNSHTDKDRKIYPEEDPQPIDPSFTEILHYAFCYIGILGGPYARYRTYDDFIKLPFSRCANNDLYKKKLRWIPLYVLVFALLERYYPLQYALSEEFRLRHLFYKMTYAVIQFQRFKMWMYCGLVMSECICCAAGFGAYPVDCHNKCTHGPTKNYPSLKKISYDEAVSLVCDYETISNIDVYETQVSPWISQYTRNWNKSIQYFMAMYVYRNIPKTKMLNPFRSIITILICAFWHGINMGFPLGMITMPLYVFTEKIYMNLHSRLSGWKSKIFAFIMFIVQYYFIGFGVMSFLLLDLNRIMIYYTSVNFVPYFGLMVIHVIGMLLLSVFKEKKALD